MVVLPSLPWTLDLSFILHPLSSKEVGFIDVKEKSSSCVLHIAALSVHRSSRDCLAFQYKLNPTDPNEEAAKQTNMYLSTKEVDIHREVSKSLLFSLIISVCLKDHWHININFNTRTDTGKAISSQEYGESGNLLMATRAMIKIKRLKTWQQEQSYPHNHV